MIINEIVSNLFTKDGVKDFISLYLELLDPTDCVKRGRSQAEFVAAAAAGWQGDRLSYEIDEAGKRIQCATKEVFSLFSLIVSSNTFGLKEAAAFTMQRALHQHMFKMLFKIDCNCRNLLAAGAGIGKHKGIEDYLKYLKTKHSLTNDDYHYISLDWVPEEGRIYDGLIQEEFKLSIYDVDKNACFQVYDKNSDPQVTFDERLYVESRLIVSKYYFAIQILSIFRHLELMTRLLTLERPNADKTCVVEIQPVPEISVFADAVKELCNIEV